MLIYLETQHDFVLFLQHKVSLFCFETQQYKAVLFQNTTRWYCFILKHNKMMVESTLETGWEMVVSSTWRIVLFVPRSSLWFHSAVMWEKFIICWRHNIAELACFESSVLWRFVTTTKSWIGCMIGVYFRDFGVTLFCRCQLVKFWEKWAYCRFCKLYLELFWRHPRVQQVGKFCVEAVWESKPGTNKGDLSQRVTCRGKEFRRRVTTHTVILPAPLTITGSGIKDMLGASKIEEFSSWSS